MAKKKATPAHGGARKGAGRPEGATQSTPLKEGTKVMRIPLSKVKAVEKLLLKK